MAFLVPSSTLTAQSSIQNITPRGLTPGQTTEIVVTGSGLATVDRLFIPTAEGSFHVVNMKRLQSSDQQATFQVQLPAELPASLYAIRLVDASGFSNPFLMVLDNCVEQTSGTLGELPAAVTATLSGDQRFRAEFKGVAKQVVAVDVHAQRIGTNGLRPVVRIYDSRGTQLAWGAPQVSIGKDAQLQVSLPEDGTYEIVVHDARYQAPQGSQFRLSVTKQPRIERLTTYAGQLGEPIQTRAIISRDKSEQTQQSSLPEFEFSVAQPDLPETSTIPGWRVLSCPSDMKFAGPMPRIWLDSSRYLSEPNTTTETWRPIGDAPLMLQGALSPGEVADRFALQVQAGHRYRCEILAQQVGSQLDASLIVLSPDQKELARNDDQAGSADPALEFVVPEGIETVHVSVNDLIGKRGDEYFYLLKVEERSHGSIAPQLPINRLVVPAGQSRAFLMPLSRSGYGGPLELKVSGLPNGWTANASALPGNSPNALVVITADDGSSETNTSEFGLLRFGFLPGDPLVKPKFGTSSEAALNSADAPWVNRDVVTMRTPTQNLRAEFGEFNQLTAWQGGHFELPLELTGETAQQASIRCRLLTTQGTPLKTIKENDQDKQVPAPELAIRIAEDEMLSPDQNAPSLPILVPANVAAGRWSLAVVAEALSADQQSVVAADATRIVSVEVKQAIQLEATLPATPLTVEPGKQLVVKGTLKRFHGFATPVELTVTGLPVGFTSEKVTIADDQQEFQVSIQVPEGTTPADLQGVQLIATAHDESSRWPLATSNAIGLPIKITPSPSQEPADNNAGE